MLLSTRNPGRGCGSLRKLQLLMMFPKCFHILKGFKAFQSSMNCSKYSENQIGFSHGNLYNLHFSLLSNSSPTKTFYNRNKLEIILYFEAEFQESLRKKRVILCGRYSLTITHLCFIVLTEPFWRVTEQCLSLLFASAVQPFDSRRSKKKCIRSPVRLNR